MVERLLASGRVERSQNGYQQIRIRTKSMNSHGVAQGGSSRSYVAM
jgi:hypothetical protein